MHLLGRKMPPGNRTAHPLPLPPPPVPATPLESPQFFFSFKLNFIPSNCNFNLKRWHFFFWHQNGKKVEFVKSGNAGRAESPPHSWAEIGEMIFLLRFWLGFVVAICRSGRSLKMLIYHCCRRINRVASATSLVPEITAGSRSKKATLTQRKQKK